MRFSKGLSWLEFCGNNCLISKVLAIFLPFYLCQNVTGCSIPTIRISGIRDILGSYNTLLIDQWGVLHDGKKPYDDVVESLTELKKRNKKMLLLSNSSKRKSSCIKGLLKVGIDTDLFVDIVTSGELAHRAILSRDENLLPFDPSISLGPLKVFVIGNGDDDFEYLSSCGCTISSPESADFILARGTFTILTSLDENKESCKFESARSLIDEVPTWLQRCASIVHSVNGKPAPLPMLVSNPDIMRPGSNDPMPGLVAEMYRNICLSRGLPEPPIKFIGKPYGIVYKECQAIAVKNNVGSEEISMCAIGDSLEHDILGASQYGIDSVWTANGVHCGAIGTREGSDDLPDETRLRELLTEFGLCVPTYTINRFVY